MPETGVHVKEISNPQLQPLVVLQTPDKVGQEEMHVDWMPVHPFGRGENALITVCSVVSDSAT